MSYLTTQIRNLITVKFARSNEEYKATFYTKSGNKKINVTYGQSDGSEHNVTGIKQAQEIIRAQSSKDIYFKLEPIRVSRESVRSKGPKDSKVSQAVHSTLPHGKDAVSPTPDISSSASTEPEEKPAKKMGILKIPKPLKNPNPFQEHIHAAQNDEHAEEMYRILLTDLFQERKKLLNELRKTAEDELTDNQRERIKELPLEMRIIEKEYNNINPFADKRTEALREFRKSRKNFGDLNQQKRTFVAEHYGNEPPLPADEIPYEKISKELKETGKPNREVQFPKEVKKVDFYIGAPPSTPYPVHRMKAIDRSGDSRARNPDRVRLRLTNPDGYYGKFNEKNNPWKKEPQTNPSN